MSEIQNSTSKIQNNKSSIIGYYVELFVISSILVILSNQSFSIFEPFR
jgi:hypothetical protein